MDPVVGLLLHALPVACVAWTVCHEEVFREFHEYCSRCAKDSKYLVQRKFAYLFTCEYCFSHWVTAALLLAFDYRLLYDDWRGVVMAFFALPFIANFYMSLYQRVRVTLRKERAVADIKEKENDAS